MSKLKKSEFSEYDLMVKGTKHFDGDGAEVSNAPKGYLRIVHLRVVYSPDASGETINKTTET
jgi:hypothetical protein